VIVVDASVLIAHLDARDSHHERAAAALYEAAAGEALGASPITIAEVLVAPARAGRIETARAALRELDVSEIGFGPDAALRLALLRAETQLKMPDCCVLLAAQDAKADAILSFDGLLADRARELGF
jgi:predicted nucleic acid-binding protein